MFSSTDSGNGSNLYVGPIDEVRLVAQFIELAVAQELYRLYQNATKRPHRASATRFWEVSCGWLIRMFQVVGIVEDHLLQDKIKHNKFRASHDQLKSRQRLDAEEIIEYRKRYKTLRDDTLQ